MGQFTVRYSIPETGNKFYNNTKNGGWSNCITGSPTKSGLNVLANCVGYVCARFNEIYAEITGYKGMKYNTLNCNAENFIERAQKAGLEIGMEPRAGAIMVWQKGATLNGSDGAGHVEICEIDYDKNHVYSSASNYGGTAFYNSHRYNTNGRWGLSSAYTFRGFIYNPAVKEETEPEPKEETITYTVQKGDTLSKIASKYGTTYQELAKLNNIANPNLIYAGQVLKIKGSTQESTYIVYTVQRGDTLSKIASRYGTTYQKIAKDNGISNPNLIYAGQVLKIYK